MASRIDAVMKEEGSSSNCKVSVDFKGESFRFKQNSSRR